ncbi:MAG: type II secretion system protein GspK [Planctomycetota bacterium]|nr:type II secretion system protein GspK [Planctomycetota bacterium]
MNTHDAIARAAVTRGIVARRDRSSFRRAFATLMVLWVLVFAVVIVAAIQASSYSQAAAGRDALARVRAHWAARAGVEAAIARVEYETENPDEQDPLRLSEELELIGENSLDGARFKVDAPAGGDAHRKFNVNRMTREQFLLFPDMTEDIADSILDWIDTDDDSRPLGAERGFYAAQAYPYVPRNGPLRSIAELELIFGCSPELVRGEDWNLNGRLDPSEDDGDASWPDDNADGVLDAGWSALMTTASVDGGYAASGQPRLDLRSAAADDVTRRVGLAPDQAQVIITHASGAAATMGDFIRRTLSQLSQEQALRPANLTNEELGTLLNECEIGAASAGAPGKLNINTCEAEALQYLPDITPGLADAIIFDRASRPSGYRSVADLLNVPAMSRNRLSRIAQSLDVRSNTFVISSRGRDDRTALEAELVVVIDRSTLPATIAEVRRP